MKKIYLTPTIICLQINEKECSAKRQKSTWEEQLTVLIQEEDL